MMLVPMRMVEVRAPSTAAIIIGDDA